MNWWLAAGTFALCWVVLAIVLAPLARGGRGRPARRWVLLAVLVAGLVPMVLLARPADPRPADPGPPGTSSPPAMVDRANDVGSRLELARVYAAQGAADQAIDQYVAVLRLDNRNAEAYASLGYLLHLAGRSEDGLWSVEEALRIDPGRADAVYFRGAILITGLDRPAEGEASLREYLRREPRGRYQRDAAELLELVKPGTR